MTRIRTIMAMMALCLCTALMTIPAQADSHAGVLANAQPASALEPLIIDLANQPVLETLHVFLLENQSLVLQDRPATVTANVRARDTDGKGQLFTSLPKSAGQEANLKATRLGDGEIKVSYRPVKGASSTLTIAVKVVPAIKEITGADNGKTITVSQGTVIKVALRGNITTGNSWSIASTAGGCVKQVGKMKYLPDAMPPSPRPVLGRGGIFVFHFQAGTGQDHSQVQLRPTRRCASPNVRSRGERHALIRQAHGKKLPERELNLAPALYATR